MNSMKKLLVIFSLCLITATLNAQDFQTKFQELCKIKDTVAQLKLLHEWEKASPKDPELFIGYFNYYIQRSLHDVISIEKTPQAKDSPQLYREGDTSHLVGYLNSHKEYKEDTLKLAVQYIDEGIKLYPNRLDMRFGKIYIVGDANYINQFVDEIVAVITYSAKNNNSWIWTNDKPVENPKSYMLTAIQDYVVKLYEMGDDQADNMILISETAIKYYPEHIESLTNLSIAYMIKKDLDKALDYLKRAEKISPSDDIVLMNIAFVYTEKKDTAKATEYYQKLLQSKDEGARKYAEEQIKKLQEAEK